MLGYALAMLEFRGQEVRLPRGHGDPDDPRRGDLRPAVRPRRERRADRHPAGPDPAVPRQPVRRLPDAAVHPRPAARPARRRPRGRRRRAAHLRPDHPAAVRSGAGDARHPDLPRQLEQLPVAAGGRPDRGAPTPCPSPWRSTPRARTARSTACSSPAPPSSCCRSCWCSWSSSAASSRASPPPASSEAAGSRRLARVPAPLRTPTDRTSTHGQQHRDSLPPPAHRGRGGRRRAVGLAAPRASALGAPAAGHRSQPGPARRPAGSPTRPALHRWAADTWHQPRRDDRREDRPAGRQHPGVPRRRRPRRATPRRPTSAATCGAPSSRASSASSAGASARGASSRPSTPCCG